MDPMEILDIDELHTHSRRGLNRTTHTWQLSCHGPMDHETFGRLVKLVERAIALYPFSSGRTTVVRLVFQIEVVHGHVDATSQQANFRAAADLVLDEIEADLVVPTV